MTLPIDEITDDIEARCADVGLADPCSLVFVVEDPMQVNELNRGLSRWARTGGSPFRAPHHSASAKALLEEADRSRGGIFLIDDLTNWQTHRLAALRNRIRDAGSMAIGVTFSTESPKGTLAEGDPRFKAAVEERAHALDAELVFVDDDGVVEPAGASVSTTASVSAADIAVVNRHRAGMGMAPVDMRHGWTPQEITDMADNIRRHGRTHNPPKYIIKDNGGETADRYSVILPEYATAQPHRGGGYRYDRNMVLCAGGSSNPYGAQGVGWVEACHLEYVNDDSRSGKRISLDDLPPKMRQLAEEVIGDPGGHGAVHVSKIDEANAQLRDARKRSRVFGSFRNPAQMKRRLTR